MATYEIRKNFGEYQSTTIPNIQEQTTANQYCQQLNGSRTSEEIQKGIVYEVHPRN